MTRFQMEGGLREQRLRQLPIGDIKPRGWLKNQLRIQADGLSGHLDEFWPSVMDSKWFGGSLPDTERAPYWLDGVVPLAWQLDDEALKAKVVGRPVKAIPYFLWANRGEGEMLVWVRQG